MKDVIAFTEMSIMVIQSLLNKTPKKSIPYADSLTLYANLFMHSYFTIKCMFTHILKQLNKI